MATEYRNSFHRPGGHYGPEFYRTDARPTDYRGYQIFRRLPECWDVVWNRVCVGQYAGLNGARGFIDRLEQGVVDVLASPSPKSESSQ